MALDGDSLSPTRCGPPPLPRRRSAPQPQAVGAVAPRHTVHARTCGAAAVALVAQLEVGEGWGGRAGVTELHR